MAVAVKNTPDVGTSRAFDRLAVASLAGTVYVLGCLGIVFKAVPALLGPPLAQAGLTGIPQTLVLVLLGTVALVALIALGLRLLGPKPMEGVKAGIFTGCVGFLVLLLLTRWASLWVEHGVYSGNWFGPGGKTVGAALVAAIGVALLILGVRLFFRPGFEKGLVRMEEQGWFTAAAYKRLQGQRVRRGTILGLLILVAAGIYTMIAHQTLSKGPPNWELNIPFTGAVEVDNPGDAPKVDPQVFPGDAVARIEAGHPVPVDRFVLRDVNQKLDPRRFVKITDPEDSNFKKDQIVSKAEFEAEVQRLKTEPGEPRPPVGEAPEPATGPLVYSSILLLPALQFTVPLLLIALTLWLAWRVVNLPVFADFLIATEAELNKVSWTTRRRLFQDTVVVLVTVFLMTVYLFGMDQVWSHLLSWKPIGVLQFQEDKSGANKSVDQKPW